MIFNDQFPDMKGRLEIYKQYEDGKMELHFAGPNAITYRAKTIMSRIIGGGLSGAIDPTVVSTFNWGSTPTAGNLRVTGMAFGNGGHLVYTSIGGATSLLPKVVGTIIVDNGLTTENTAYPGMPAITPVTHGYNTVVNQQVSGTTYEKVENGNVPWDGTTLVQDNAIGVSEPNTTLYSETFRVPLDFSGVNDGIRYISKTEVQFKATIPAVRLNYTGTWGFMNREANKISEAGLIIGYAPTAANLIANTGQLYSSNGGQPAAGNFNSNTSGTTGWASKDTTYNAADGLGGTTTPANTRASFAWGSKPVTSLSSDAWAVENLNTWNTLSRKAFPVLTKQASFSLVAIWTVSF